MKEKFLLLVLICAISLSTLFAQETYDEEIQNDIIKMNYEKKSAKTAMLLSSLFPGSGQLYANRRSITGYVFAGIEIGLWTGYIIYKGDAQDQEDKYMDFADEHYSRTRQNEVSADMIAIQENDIYTTDHFRLDADNTQHFYEDIGKYNKYIFGWEDWYDKYYANGVHWVWDGDGADDPNHKWLGNYPTHPDFASQENFDSPSDGSALRDQYIKMRQDAEDSFDTAQMFSWGLVANHILSAIDAVRVTRNYNSEYLSQNENKAKVFFATGMFDNQLTPMLRISKRF